MAGVIGFNLNMMHPENIVCPMKPQAPQLPSLVRLILELIEMIQSTDELS